MAPEIIAAIGIAGTAGFGLLSAALTVKWTAASTALVGARTALAVAKTALAKAVEERDQYKSERDLAETASATLAHAVKAQEGQIKVLGREVGEYRMKAPKRGANGKFIAKIPGRANGSGRAGVAEQG